MVQVFIDGKEGTTGLRIFDRLAGRKDIALLTLKEEQRKERSARKEMLNSCDIAFLCLPDAAAQEAVALIENERTRVIDASTAHRTLPGWQYGFPELFENGFAKVKNAPRVAVPGCHASGFIALIYPLIQAGFLEKDALLTCHSLTGYSGGGKKMIAEYEADKRSRLLDAPRQYGITQQHKHLKEMQAVCGLQNAPVFCPIVAPFYSGMLVTVPLFAKQLKKGGIEDIRRLYAAQYGGPLVRYSENSDEAGFLSSNARQGSDAMEISVFGNEERLLLTARYDNLGKGASGAAIECMNIMLGCDPLTGLEI